MLPTASSMYEGPAEGPYDDTTGSSPSVARVMQKRCNWMGVCFLAGSGSQTNKGDGHEKGKLGVDFRNLGVWGMDHPVGHFQNNFGWSDE
jgi:hypothetical protein